MRTQWIERKYLNAILLGLQLENRIALKVALQTGMRISDVLSIPACALHKDKYTYTEIKTGKQRTVRLDYRLRRIMQCFASDKFAFPHRTNPDKHRTRQAVFLDLKRMAKAFHIKRLAPHTMRKCYAVDKFRKNGGDIIEIQRDFNHDDPVVTLLYALSDKIAPNDELTF